jgi:3-(3-hydroxy-phenyl)propionate hydroxylase
VYRFHSRCVDRMRVGRVLLAGDCAHLVAPFGARGLNSGVPDAENAAWKLAFVLHGWAPKQLLETYNDERLAAAQENLRVTGATMRFLVPQNEEQQQARRALLETAVDDPDAASRVDSGRFAEPFWYVDSPLTTPDPTRTFPAHPGPGETPPVAPGVLLPDAGVTAPGLPQVTRLRELTRDGVLALTCDGVDVAEVSVALKESTDTPHRVLRLCDLDPKGGIAAALGTRPGETWLIRPDGHVAAVLRTPDRLALHRATRRLLGNPG